MKKTMRYLSMAALALVGAMMTGCSSDDFNAQPAKNVITVTTTVDLDDNDATRSLSWDGSTMNKTFAVGEKLSLKYEKDGGGTAKVESAALTAGNITNEGKKATFTFTITDPKSDGAVSYVYPAAMADDNGDPDYTKLATQDGTLASIAANLDLATSAGSMTGTTLPHLSLANQLAICAFTLKDNAATPNDITSTITSLTINDGTYNYNVTRSAAAGPIYVAIRPTSGATMNYIASSSTKSYSKTTTSKTYAAGHLLQLGLRMAEFSVLNLASVTVDTTVPTCTTITGTLGAEKKISIADGATVTLQNVSINASNTWQEGLYAGITCEGDATIILSGTNTVKGFEARFPGIFVPESKTLIIKGDGSLTSATGVYGPEIHGCGIGGVCAFDKEHAVTCGNIEIQGGTITAVAGNNSAGIGSGGYGSCGSITISGGNVTATCNGPGAAIGSGYQADCGNILISGGTVNATGGYYGPGIGSGASNGYNSSCGTITISGGTVTARGGQAAAGIGTGYRQDNSKNTNCGNITITTGVTSVTVYPGAAYGYIWPADKAIGAGAEADFTGTIYVGDDAGITQITGNPWVYPAP